jgi:hypothetical protein
VLLALTAVLAACDAFFPPPEQHYRGIDVYEDRYEFRFSTYTSIRRLEIALEATTDELEVVNVRECVDNERLEEVLDLLRRLGRASVAITLPENC